MNLFHLILHLSSGEISFCPLIVKKALEDQTQNLVPAILNRAPWKYLFVYFINVVQIFWSLIWII